MGCASYSVGNRIYISCSRLARSGWGGDPLHHCPVAAVVVCDVLDLVFEFWKWISITVFLHSILLITVFPNASTSVCEMESIFSLNSPRHTCPFHHKWHFKNALSAQIEKVDCQSDFCDASRSEAFLQRHVDPGDRIAPNDNQPQNCSSKECYWDFGHAQRRHMYSFMLKFRSGDGATYEKSACHYFSFVRITIVALCGSMARPKPAQNATAARLAYYVLGAGHKIPNVAKMLWACRMPSSHLVFQTPWNCK